MSEQPEPVAAYRLPSGRHGIPAEEVAENQRWRLLAAAADVLAECGHVDTTSVRIAKRAGVSSATFYKNFDNVGDCLLVAHETAAECVMEVVSEACEEEHERHLRVGEAVDAALAFLAAEPGMAGLLGAEAAAGYPAIAASREQLIDRLAGLLVAGRPATSRRPAGASRHAIAGALNLVSERVAAGEAAALPGLTSQLTEMVRLAQLG